ncbi:hypothetical protein H6F86_04775 [Phormidium sp. FACHB-592]|uniref:Uncharacterized protein n=1 Tax=Stenomitos frigidus AS-A4 TaxID=2933935 RepID=A0ABV0KL41_9CYAN|nr:hypothetical protein [Phormidium sp. FACHB-592]MBD2073211.1 hypothetical protein [Phormidium sp. FACHB-592]
MPQDLTAFRKISFQTVDVEVALAEIEYQYLKFVCEATLRNSDDVLREQIRHLRIAGLPSFDDWRKQGVAQGLLLPPIETNTIPTIAVESSDSAVDTVVEPQSDETSASPIETSAPKAQQTKAKSSAKAPALTSPSKATDTLLKSLSDPSTAKLTSREVIEQQHEQLTVLLKEGKTMDDLAALLTSNGAKISASTLRNYLSAARRKAKVGRGSAKKSVSVDATPAATETRSSDTADTVAEPTDSSTSEPSLTAETPVEPTLAPPKPTRGRPKAAAKSTLEHETSVIPSRSRKQPSPLDVSPVPRRRKSRI